MSTGKASVSWCLKERRSRCGNPTGAPCSFTPMSNSQYKQYELRGCTMQRAFQLYAALDWGLGRCSNLCWGEFENASIQSLKTSHRMSIECSSFGMFWSASRKGGSVSLRAQAAGFICQADVPSHQEVSSLCAIRIPGLPSGLLAYSRNTT